MSDLKRNIERCNKLIEEMINNNASESEIMNALNYSKLVANSKKLGYDHLLCDGDPYGFSELCKKYGVAE